MTMTMSHGFEHRIAQAADDSLAPDARVALDAHLAVCDDCRALLAAQRDARAVLMQRPIVAVRDLSAEIRRTLEAERPWIDRLNINWRVWSLRVAPVAAALAVVAVMAVQSVDTSTALSEASNTATAGDANASVASALWTGDVSEDTLLALLLRADAEDALSSYVPAATPVTGAKER